MSLFKILKLSIFLLCNENISWNELYICFQIIFFSFVLNDNEENRHLIARKVNDGMNSYKTCSGWDISTNSL